MENLTANPHQALAESLTHRGASPVTTRCSRRGRRAPTSPRSTRSANNQVVDTQFKTATADGLAALAPEQLQQVTADAAFSQELAVNDESPPPADMPKITKHDRATVAFAI